MIYSDGKDIQSMFSGLLVVDDYRTVTGPNGLPAIALKGKTTSAYRWWKGENTLATVFVIRPGWKVIMDLEGSYSSPDQGPTDTGEVPPAEDSAETIAEALVTGEGQQEQA